MIEVEIPELFGAENSAWHVVLDLADADLPRWVLAGGLMVHLHLYEAGVTPNRVTTDVDALVDVSLRAVRATEEFARRLQDDLHMRLEPPSADNVGHRFTRDDGAIVDVLAADFGERSRPHITIPPAKTVEVPGGRELLTRTEEVRVILTGAQAWWSVPLWSLRSWESGGPSPRLRSTAGTPTVTFATPPGCSPSSTRTPWPQRGGSAGTSDTDLPRSRPDLNSRAQTVISSLTRLPC